jgi:DNA-directed RNA polymerase specialized sigma24 family protein
MPAIAIAAKRRTACIRPQCRGSRQEPRTKDDTLDELAKFDSRKVRVIEMRFFVGLSVEEVGSVLGISPQSVMSDWKLAKVCLKAHLEEGTRSLVSVSFLTRTDEGGHVGLR